MNGYGIIFLYIDPQLNFGAFKKRSKKEEESGIEGSVDDMDNEDVSDDVMSDLNVDDGGASVSEDENASEISEDDGVFDVDRNSLSSFTESQNSTSFPQPRTARVKQVDFEHNSDSDAQIGTDENVSEVRFMFSFVKLGMKFLCRFWFNRIRIDFTHVFTQSRNLWMLIV